jgi:hypothetical protein
MTRPEFKEKLAEQQKTQVLAFLNENSPTGSEGGLQIRLNDGLHSEESNAIDWATISISGDLRDWNEDEDDKILQNWLKKFPKQLQEAKYLIRQALFEIHDETYDMPRIIAWNGDKWVDRS